MPHTPSCQNPQLSTVSGGVTLYPFLVLARGQKRAPRLPWAPEGPYDQFCAISCLSVCPTGAGDVFIKVDFKLL